MYLVIDLAEFSPCDDEKFKSDIIYWDPEVHEDCNDDKFYLYNTQVVFDRNGMIIARCVSNMNFPII